VILDVFFNEGLKNFLQSFSETCTPLYCTEVSFMICQSVYKDCNTVFEQKNFTLIGIAPSYLNNVLNCLSSNLGSQNRFLLPTWNYLESNTLLTA